MGPWADGSWLTPIFNFGISKFKSHGPVASERKEIPGWLHKIDRQFEHGENRTLVHLWKRGTCIWILKMAEEFRCGA